MTMVERVAEFSDLTLDNAEEAGGKGANLGEMVSAGLPVPPGFVLLRDGYRDAMRAAGVDGQLAALHRDALAAASEPDKLDDLSRRLQAVVAEAGVADDVRAEILGAYHRLGDQPLVAVRSSATGEDGRDASFAGMNRTLTNVRGDDELIQAVLECWMSLFGSRVIAYRASRGFTADPAMAIELAVNAKLRRTGVCGATETLLVDREAAERLLPPVLDALIAAGCAVRGDETVRSLEPRAAPATERDWYTEYLDAILAVKVVAGLEEAIAHVNRYGSHHTDCIVAADAAAAERFLREVDSAIVIHNASTQFADGGEFGMGAEIGIATGRLHARGPVGVEQLTSYKYVVRGSGQVRPG